MDGDRASKCRSQSVELRETLPAEELMECGKTPPFFIVFYLCLAVSFASAQSRQPIKTIVVLVLENRSFDHMLGWMKQSVSPSIDGLTGRECNAVAVNRTICVSDDADFVDPDPGHSFDAVKQQVFGSGRIPSMTGFVEQALSLSPNLSRTVMKCFNPQSLPVFSLLVSEFAVFDRWFCSLPGPTQPNRLFVYSATSHGSIDHDKIKLAAGYPQKTIFDSLHHDSIDFGIYYQSLPSTLFYRNLRRLKFLTNKFHRYSKFLQHSEQGKLPSLTVIEPRYFDLRSSPANDDHPAHDVAYGQMLVKEIYETLRRSPQWNETLFIITYDEHGGFFDHVPTPASGVPSPDGNTSPRPDLFRFDRLGVRVPTIMVSPWIRKGTVIGKATGPTPTSEFEHSSIPATIKKIFHLSSKFLTHRDAWAGTFEHVVAGLTQPRTDCPEILPEVRRLRSTEADEDRNVSEFQSELVDLAAVLNGDHLLNTFRDEAGRRKKKMTVKKAERYVRDALTRFIAAGREALVLGANGSTIVDMRASLTTRSSSHRH